MLRPPDEFLSAADGGSPPATSSYHLSRLSGSVPLRLEAVGRMEERGSGWLQRLQRKGRSGGGEGALLAHAQREARARRDAVATPPSGRRARKVTFQESEEGEPGATNKSSAAAAAANPGQAAAAGGGGGLWVGSRGTRWPDKRREEARIVESLRKRVEACQVFRAAMAGIQLPPPPPPPSAAGDSLEVASSSESTSPVDDRPRLLQKILSNRPITRYRIPVTDGMASGGKMAAEEESALEPQWRDSEFITECLFWHNAFRHRHAAPPLSISTQLCSHAQSWANHLAHTNSFHYKEGERSLGQNLFCRNTHTLQSDVTGAIAISYALNALTCLHLFRKWKSMDVVIHHQNTPNHNGQEVASHWYSAVRQYDYLKEPDILHANVNAGHFTQMVWVGSKELGLGKARSRSGKVVVVANYRPAGNISGQFQQNVLPPIELDLSSSPGSGGGGGGGGGGSTGGSGGGGSKTGGGGKGRKSGGVGCLWGIRSRPDCQHNNNNEDDNGNNNNDDNNVDEEKTSVNCVCVMGKRPEQCVVCSTNHKYMTAANLNCAVRLVTDVDGARSFDDEDDELELCSGDEGLYEGEDALSEYSSSNTTSRSTEFGV